MRLVFLGRPGAGKSTQAIPLAESQCVPHVSTGDLLRDAIARGLPAGTTAEQYIKQGKLTPDDIVIEIAAERIAQGDCERGFFFDGFPRTLPQACALDALLASRGLKLDGAILIETPAKQILQRITKRRIDPLTGEIYNLVFAPPPPDVVSHLIHRPDDTESACRARLAQYRDESGQLLEYYQRKNCLRIVDGVGDVNEVAHRLRIVLADCLIK